MKFEAMQIKETFVSWYQERVGCRARDEDSRVKMERRRNSGAHRDKLQFLTSRQGLAAVMDHPCYPRAMPGRPTTTPG